MFGRSCISELYMIDFLLQLDRLEMVELRLVRLYLRMVSVVKIPGILERACMLEHNHSSSSVAHSKIVATAIEGNRS